MIKKITILLGTVIICLFCGEFLLRLFDIKPWSYVKISNILSDKKIYQDHASLGWKAKKGKYIIKQNYPNDGYFNLTIGENSERKNNKENIKKNNKIFVIGGSFTQGWGVNDQDTYSSKIEKKYLDFDVYNFGQSGYGSIQSLLMLKKQIKKTNSPQLIIYGFIEHHEYRNVARTSWLKTLAMYSDSGAVKTPYGYIGNNSELLIGSPLSYPKFPYKESSSIITLIEKVYAKNMSKKTFLRDSDRKKQQQSITEKTILEMKETSSKHNSNFVVLILDWKNKNSLKHYEGFLKKNSINFINCSVPLIDEMVILGDYHPTEKAHTHYSSCLMNYIDKNKLIL